MNAIMTFLMWIVDSIAAATDERRRMDHIAKINEGHLLRFVVRVNGGKPQHGVSIWARDGFTLIELLIALAITGILVGVVVLGVRAG